MRRNERRAGTEGRRQHPGRKVPGVGLLSVVFVGVFAPGLEGCGAGNTGIQTGAELRKLELVHEPCDLGASGAERLDANGDGRPDVTLVRQGKLELCRASDLDFDGRIDLYTYFDPYGKATRRELDYDRDGSVDEIQLFKAGELSEKQRASTLARRLDTWETYVQGRLVKAERDSDGDGRIDQWWEYKTPDCPLIRTDIDGDGQPDPTSVLDYCAVAGYKPPEQATTATPSILSKETEALPTETSNKEVLESAEPATAPETGTGSPTEPGPSKPRKNP